MCYGEVRCRALRAPCRWTAGGMERSGWRPGNVQSPPEEGEAQSCEKRLAQRLLVTGPCPRPP